MQTLLRRGGQVIRKRLDPGERHRRGAAVEVLLARGDGCCVSGRDAVVAAQGRYAERGYQCRTEMDGILLGRGSHRGSAPQISGEKSDTTQNSSTQAQDMNSRSR
jgi:hypothetical protein